ncbi:ABC transporter substrate-binding protein [Synergistales bacterium]|nr:ABC transporter substrate-binding protein [Synergistales bacterium]
MKKVLLALSAFVLVVALSGSASEAAAKKWRIALSNDYAGNIWRQTMLNDWKAAAAEAKALGLIEEAPDFTINDGSAAEQAAQIQNLILEGYDAIVIQAGSPTALNAAIRQGIDAGIVMLCYENATTEKDAWNIIPSYHDMGLTQTDFIAKHFPSGGNLLEVRGIAGTTVNEDIHNGILESLKRNPNLKVVNEVYGNWTQSVAQQAVAGIIPSLPNDIIAVVTQGGDGLGTVNAFQAAGRKIPMVIMGNRYEELEKWKELKSRPEGYTTMSVSGLPGISTIAFWTTLEVLGDPTSVPKELHVSVPVIYDDQLDHFLEITPKGGVVTIRFPQSWVKEFIANAKAGKPAPAAPSN